MSARNRSHHRRLGSHSRSTPNFATIKEERPPLPTWSSPNSKTQAKKRQSPARARKSPTFVPGAPSEPVSADEEEDDTSSTHSGSSFERDLLSRTTSYTGSASSSDAEATDGLPEHDPIKQLRSSRSTHSSLGRQPYTSRSQSSLGPLAFAPPFYNRPPTPLPPSPSLTSLLRPRAFPSAFSPSRPTTPDSSDTEATGVTSIFGIRPAYSSASLSRKTTNNSIANGIDTSTPSATPSTAGLVAATALTTPGPVPRASPKLPSNEYYGFVLYLGSSLAFFLYLLWSYLPTPFLHQLGIYYYPDRWWSLAVPSWLVMALVWTYVALASYNTGYLTLKLGSLECLVDEKGRLAVLDARGRIVERERRRESGTGQGRAGKKQRRRRERERKERERKERERKEREKETGKVKELDLDWRTVWSMGTDAVMDVPIGGVCEVLYGQGRESGGSEDDAVDQANENG